MLLTEYKEKKKVNISHLAAEFKVTPPTMYAWMNMGASISGSKGKRIITVEKELGRE